MDAEFACVEPFSIDDGQLADLTPQECFVLGYELADISRLAELDPEGFDRPVHADNRLRIEAAIQKRGRKCRLSWSGDDQSETWMNLSVAPRD